MTNHVHLILVPEREDSLARALGPAHCRYAHAVHPRQNSTGHLWQNRFYSTVMDEAHLLAAMRYVERNPVRAGRVDDAVHYRWSSAAAPITGHDEAGSLDLAYGTARFRRDDWRRELGVAEDADLLTEIRTQTHTGRPLASKDFVVELARTMRRALQPRPVGRPRKRREDGIDTQLAPFSAVTEASGNT